MGATLIDLKKGRRAPPSGTPPADDVPPELYAKRRQIYPKLVFGKFRAAKWLVLILALAVYYILPWIRWDHGEGAPNQAVLADFEGGRFYFFFIEIWPQEVYYITGLLILAALGLFLVTSLFGRVWCGYACPQTVWTDLFIAVERFFEGDRNARIKLDRGPWTLNKLARKTAKHAVWLGIAFATGGAWILYWHDAPTLAHTFFRGEAPMSAYIYSVLLTFTTYTLAGTMREQVCTYMCPWPRIQAALTDADALNVTYRSDRGEPRGAHKKGETWEGRGDCIDCTACVTACPMGIDIRDGAQLECIHCALCIDACDDMMKKVGRPTGLVAYDTEVNVARRTAKQAAIPFRFIRPRTLVYTSLIVAIATVMIYGLSTRSTFDLSVLKDRSPPFVLLSTGDIRNGYTIKLVNKRPERRSFRLSVKGAEGASIEVIGFAKGDSATVNVEPETVERYRLLVTFPRRDLNNGIGRLVITAQDVATHEQAANAVRIAGPEENH